MAWPLSCCCYYIRISWGYCWSLLVSHKVELVECTEYRSSWSFNSNRHSERDISPWGSDEHCTHNQWYHDNEHSIHPRLHLVHDTLLGWIKSKCKCLFTGILCGDTCLFSYLVSESTCRWRQFGGWSEPAATSAPVQDETGDEPKTHPLPLPRDFLTPFSAPKIFPSYLLPPHYLPPSSSLPHLISRSFHL